MLRNFKAYIFEKPYILFSTLSVFDIVIIGGGPGGSFLFLPKY